MTSYLSHFFASAKCSLLVCYLISQPTLFSSAQSVSDMLENTLPSVVTVAVYKTEFNDLKKMMGFNTRGIDPDTAYRRALEMYGNLGSGSGFIIEQNGKKYVITNAHVVEQAAEKLGSICIFTITQKKYNMRLLGGDTFYDVAVLEFSDPPGNEIKTVEFEERQARIGETVFAIGNPLGEYPYTVTQGIVSGKNRVTDLVVGKYGFLQSTATIIWGNSGGPLISTAGKVIGINSQIKFARYGEESIWQPQVNFALENNIAKRLVTEIIDFGYVKRGYLGIELGQKYNLAESRESLDEKVILYNVNQKSPAASVLKDKIGYNVIKINDMEIRTLEEALGELEKIKPGQNVSLTFSKNASVEVVTITAEELNKNRLMEQLNQFIKTKDVEVIPGTESLVIALPVQTEKQNSQNTAVKKRYPLFSAGIYSSSTPRASYLWTVQTPGDLAAVLRTTGQYGFIDLLLYDATSKKVFPKKLVVSYQKGTYNKAIWY